MIRWTFASVAVALLFAIGLRGQAVQPTLYEINVGNEYHLEKCKIGELYKLVPIRPIDIKDKGLKPCLACKPLSDPSVVELMASTPDPRVSFTTAVLMTIRKEPKGTGPVVGTMAAGSLASVLDLQPGWAKIKLVSDEAGHQGWVAATPANLSQRSLFDAIGIHIKMEGKAWPAATRAAIYRREVKIGFTAEQLETSLGSPISTTTEETAAGAVEVRIYLDRAVTLVAGKVTRIVTTK